MPNSSEYCIYLRKSRADLEAEARGAGDTLARHEHILMELAASRALPIGAIYRELASGERISTRPVMQQLLSEVEECRWAGVLVTETSRLARGDTIDQGIVAQAFKLSNTFIITPQKDFDPQNEMDEEWFEIGLFMSRQEYRMIRRRQLAGMQAAKREGRFIGNTPPYGYERYKLPSHGWSLRPVEEEAAVVRMIFDMYLSGTGYNLIEKRLNDLHIRPPKGEAWSRGTIPGILRNPHYAGYIPSGYRCEKKQVIDGVIVKTRPRNHNFELYEGLHEPIISRDVWERTQARFGKNAAARTPGNRNQTNPLAGLLVCDCCGRLLQRRPQTGTASSTTLLCPTRGCPTVSHSADELEHMVLDSLRTFLCKLDLGTVTAPDLTAETRAIAEIEKQLSDIDARIRRTFVLVEDGTYTRDMFLSRQKELSSTRAKLLSSRSDLESKIGAKQKEFASRSSLSPAVRHVIDAYDFDASAKERNKLLKQVIDHIDYHKRTRLRWKSESDLSLTLHPVILPPANH